MDYILHDIFIVTNTSTKLTEASHLILIKLKNVLCFHIFQVTVERAWHRNKYFKVHAFITVLLGKVFAWYHEHLKYLLISRDLRK